jgi:hypothetical protein
MIGQAIRTVSLILQLLTENMLVSSAGCVSFKMATHNSCAMSVPRGEVMTLWGFVLRKQEHISFDRVYQYLSQSIIHTLLLHLIQLYMIHLVQIQTVHSNRDLSDSSTTQFQFNSHETALHRDSRTALQLGTLASTCYLWKQVSLRLLSPILG